MPAHHLTAPAGDIVDEIRFAKELSGETFDGRSEETVRKAIEGEIRAAQAHFRNLRITADGSYPVYRAMRLSDGQVASLAPGDALGTCWSDTLAGAHAYYGASRDGLRDYVVAALVAEGDVDWAMSIAVHSSGEGELRLLAGATVRLIWLRPGKPSALGEPLREDLEGAEFGTGQPLPGTSPAPGR